MIERWLGQLRSPEGRTSLFYFCFYMGNGAAASYLPIWLVQKGVLEDQIGYINAVPIILMIAINLIVGRIADRAKDWRQVIVVATAISGLAPLGLFFVSGFWGILVVYALTMVPLMAAGPVADAASLRLTRRRGSDFGFIRAWGTVGFMGLNAATGFLAAAWGAVVFLPIFAGVGLLRAAAALQLPRFRAEQSEAKSDAAPKARARLLDALKPWFVLAIVGAAMLYSCHYLLQGFAALIWKNAGMSEAVIGPLVAVSAFAEALMMFGFRRFASRFSARYLILAAALTMAARLAIMAFNPPVALLFLLQTLHAITFALGYLGTVNFIANWTSEDIAAEAQSFYVVVVQVVSAAALIGFGYLTAVAGAGAFLGGAALALAGAVCVIIS
ncbi:MAG: MFS transporter, partial [Cucumibacter sp.]